MKVKELIELLSEFDPEADIRIDCRDVEITAEGTCYWGSSVINLST